MPTEEKKAKIHYFNCNISYITYVDIIVINAGINQKINESTFVGSKTYDVSLYKMKVFFSLYFSEASV